MASRVGLGVPLPQALPITGTFAVPFIAYFLLLSSRIVRTRIATHAYIGDVLSEAQLAKLTSKEKEKQKKQSDAKASPQPTRQNSDPLTLNSRAFNNFLENVPLAFILLGTAELNGGDKRVLGGLMGALLFCRLVHVEVGIYGEDNAAWGRPVGYFGSCAVLAALAGYGGWLVRGYWGF